MLGQTPMVVMHLRQRAVATFDGRGGPLKRLGLLSRPHFPPLKHIGRELLGDRVSVKRVLNGFQGLSELGVAARATRVQHVQMPIHQRQQCLCNPAPPPRRQDHLLSILLHPLPPKVDERGNASERFAHLGPGGRFDGQAMRCD